MTTSNQQLFDSFETKLTTYLDKRLDTIKDDFLSVKADVRAFGDDLKRLTENSAARTDVTTLQQQVSRLQATSDVHTDQITKLENASKDAEQVRRESPFRTWQVIAAVIALFMTCAFSSFGAVIQLINFIRHP